MKTAEYWAKRFTQLEDAQHALGTASMPEIERLYREAEKDLEKKISVWYQRFSVNNQITLAEARKWLTGKDLKEFQWDVKEYIKHGEKNVLTGQWMKELENASAKWHISRYEALKMQVRQSFEELAGKYNRKMTETMKDVYRSGYYHTAFEIQKGFGVGYDIAGVNQKQVEAVISKPWAADGVNFSERIWKDKQKLIDTAHRELTQGIMLGKDPKKTIEAIAKRMDVSKHQAGRLVMTEEAYFSSASQKQAFAELGVEKYEIVATLDNRTSEICRELDGKVFDMKDYRPGETAPPFHVNCRTTTAPHFDDDFDVVGERAARDEGGTTYYVPADMTYREWEKRINTDALDNLSKHDRLIMYRHTGTHRKQTSDGHSVIDKATYHKITNAAIRKGADIRVADEEWKRHLKENNASAVSIGDIIYFSDEATVSDVLEEVHHFYQNRSGLNVQYDDKQRIIMNEIDAKEYLLRVIDKYHIPDEETALTRNQLESYRKEKKLMQERGDWVEKS